MPRYRCAPGGVPGSVLLPRARSPSLLYRVNLCKPLIRSRGLSLRLSFSSDLSKNCLGLGISNSFSTSGARLGTCFDFIIRLCTGALNLCHLMSGIILLPKGVIQPRGFFCRFNLYKPLIRSGTVR